MCKMLYYLITMRLTRLADPRRNGKRNYIRRDERKECEVCVVVKKTAYLQQRNNSMHHESIRCLHTISGWLYIGCKVNLLILVKDRLSCIFAIIYLSIFLSFTCN